MVIVKKHRDLFRVNTICCLHRAGSRGVYPERIHHRAKQNSTVVEAFSRRLQVQGKIDKRHKELHPEHPQPLGVAVVIEAQHMYDDAGRSKQNSVTTTSDFSGAFEKLATRRNSSG